MQPIHTPEPPKVAEASMAKEFDTIPSPERGPVVVAVYKFDDKTGQRKPGEKFSNISYAVTQGADAWVINALQDVGQGKWFTVVERVGLDSLTKERQIIRQARQQFATDACEKEKAKLASERGVDPDTIQCRDKPLPPLMQAGMIVEGGITGYDSNIKTGGSGARYLGIGPSTQYRQDVVTVSMRVVAVSTGEVIITVSTTKTILSTGNSFTFFKFFDLGTQAAEIEAGHTINEPVGYAVRAAIDQAVVEVIKEGERKGYWAYSTPYITKQLSVGQGAEEGNHDTENSDSSSDTTNNTSDSE
jgi:curli production assembly/transport component CsgG